MFKWGRYFKGYEVSSKGDKRFSAIHAIMPDGRCLESHYQNDKKGYCPGSKNWSLGKGRPPKDRRINLWEEYLGLWKIWADLNEDLILELKTLAEQNNHTLTDVFANSDVNQARALVTILNEKFCSHELPKSVKNGI
jgi:hypothetical protein